MRHHLQVFLLNAGKAIGLALSGILAGVAVGSLLNLWLQVDIVPIAVSSCTAFVLVATSSLWPAR